MSEPAVQTRAPARGIVRWDASMSDRAAQTHAERPERGARGLGFFDFTLLVISAIIGADVYVVSGFGSRYLGPAQLVAWAVAGVLAALIGLTFVQCATVCPRTGGSYAYVREAFGPFLGFLAGWS